ncbi:MAG TPA: PQQ-dependent sugar dehydrogenase [Kofleriaceae bacterium]
MRTQLLCVLAMVASCHGQQAASNEADRAPAHGSAASSGSSTASAAVAPSAVKAPAGTAELVAVPKDVVGKVALKQVIDGLERPVLLVTATNDPRKRMFVIEQRGRIRVIEGGKLLAKPFFTISGLSDGNEEGLLGLAFHPKFAENGRLYVDYTSADMKTHIVEYRVASPSADSVDPTTARELVVIDHPYSNHNGGNLLFGPDGKLYAGMGDGGSAGDPHKNGQNPHALLGKILRFDVEAAKPMPEVVHIGSRNPWRFWFDAPTGDLYIGDVGQNLWENVYVVASDGVSHNFGWNVVEGNHCFEAETCDRSQFTAPVADYPHEQGCSVTGGVTYRGKALPALAGRYFYADYCTGLLRSFVWTHDPSSPTAPGWVREHWDWKSALDPDGKLQQISSFGVDADGEVYIVELTGQIYELVPRT